MTACTVVIPSRVPGAGGREPASGGQMRNPHPPDRGPSVGTMRIPTARSAGTRTRNDTGHGVSPVERAITHGLSPHP
jgi:hypothetical protein